MIPISNEIDRQALLNTLSDSLKQHELEVEDLRQLVKETAGDLPVYVAGSMVDGLANQYSDVDLFVISDDKDAPPTIQITNLKSLRVDFEWWPRSKLSEITEVFVDAINLSRLLDVHSKRLLITAHRLVTGIPMNSDYEVRHFQQELPPSQLIVYMLRYWMGNCDNDLQDSLGAYHSGDLDYAWSRSTDGIGHAIDLLVALNGSTNPDPKFRVKLMKKYLPQAEVLMEQYRAFHSEWPTSDDDMVEGIVRRIKFTKAFLRPIARSLSQSKECHYSMLREKKIEYKPPSTRILLETETCVAECLSTRHAYVEGELILLTYEKGFPAEQQLRINPIGAIACEFADGTASIASIATHLASEASFSYDTTLDIVRHALSDAVAAGFYEVINND